MSNYSCLFVKIKKGTTKKGRQIILSNLKLNKMINKKIVYGVGAVALLGVAYYAMKKKKSSVGTVDTATEIIEIAPYSIQWKDDPTNAVYIVENGKKYGLISEKAFVAYGYSVPKLVTKEQLDAIPIGGFVNELGKITKN